MKRKQLLALVLVIAIMLGLMPCMEAKAFEWGECPSSYSGIHVFVTGNRCFWCGYNRCTHTNNKWNDKNDSSVPPVYMFENEQNHRVYNSYNRYCWDCGEYMGSFTDDGTLKAHSFTNGDTCVCGYKKPVCTHAGRNWEDVYDSSKDFFSDITSEDHTKYKYSDRYCKDCGAYVTTVNKVSVTQKHNFSNGNTCICGYKKPVSGGEGQHVGVSAKIDTEYRQYGNATAHQKRDVYGYTCSICSETIIDRYSEWTEESHRDSGDGWCLYCGAAVGASKDWEPLIEGDPSTVASTSLVKGLLTSVQCPHSLSIRTNYEELNATFHFDKKYTVCSICGMEELIKINPVDHTLDSTGKCTVCGCKDARVQKYYATLKKLPSDSNPLNNSVIKQLINAELADSGLEDDPEMIEQIMDTVHDAPETFRDIYVYSFFLYDKNVDSFEKSTNESNYDMFDKVGEDEYVITNILSVDTDTIDDTDFLTTWFHESGHATEANHTFDQSVWTWATNRYMALTDCFETMKDDVETFIVAQATSHDHPFLTKKWNALTQQEQELIIQSIIGSNNGYPSRFNVDEDVYELQATTLNKELQDLRDEIIGNMKVAAYGGTRSTRNAYMVTDCIEGMTNGRASNTVSDSNMDFFDDVYSLWGLKYYSGAHLKGDSSYWYDEDGQPNLSQCMEAWAEYYAAVMTKNTDAINSNLYYFPSTCEYFDQTFAPQVLENIKRLALE